MFRHHGQYFFHVMDEAHVQHAVGFVKHQHLHLAQIEHALLQQIQQATGCCHQDVHAFFYPADLGVHAHAAKNDGGGKLQVFAVGLHGFFHLRRQLAGGCQDQGTNAKAAEFVARCFASAKFVQHGQDKCCRLASSGLGPAQ